MKRRHQFLLGMAGVGGLALAARALLRRQRKIDLKGKVVIVTGSSSGFGLLIARQAAEQGARLVLAARGEADLDAAAADLKSTGAEVIAVPTDLTDEGQARNLIARAIERFGRVDILVNNAGIISVGPIETMTVDDYRAAMATNFWGELYPILAVLPHMRAQGSGRIVNVSSVGGKVSVPHLLPYSVSKFALTGLTEGLRAELAKDNILVTGIYPGTIRTGGHSHATFKGNRNAEFTWFALSDTVPVVSTSAEYAAKKLWNAVVHGDPEAVIGWNARLAVVFHNLFPEWTVELMGVVNRFLPAAGETHGAAIPGSSLTGKIPDMLNKVNPPGTRAEPA